MFSRRKFLIGGTKVVVAVPVLVVTATLNGVAPVIVPSVTSKALTVGNFPKALWPGIKAYWGKGNPADAYSRALWHDKWPLIPYPIRTGQDGAA